MDNVSLVKEALEARKMAYAPYSHHSVGAALVCDDGTVIHGCNIENAGYTPSNCAERTAFFKAVSEGRTKFTRIAVVGGMDDAPILEECAPCGVCRQVMMEFCDPKTFEIILAKVEGDKITPSVHTLEEILPMGFGPNNLL